MDTLATQIKNDIDRMNVGHAEWVAGAIDLCRHLAEAKRQYPSTKAFNKWLVDNGLGEDKLHHADRAAAIAMGQHPEECRAVLEKTERRSLRHIYEHEWRLTHVGKSESKPRKARRSKTVSEAEEAVLAKKVLDEGKSEEDAAADLGLDRHHARHAAAKENARREERANPTIDIDKLVSSMTAKQKLERAIKQIRAELEAKYEAKFRVELRRYIEEKILPRYREKEAEADRVLKHRRGLMTKADYNKILKCLHPDRVHGDPELEAMYNEAFRIFKNLTIMWLDNKEMPIEPGTMPKTWEELQRMRDEVRAANSARSKEAWARRKAAEQPTA